ncbi:MAG: DNA polymerase III subunit delta [Pyrinomonadaceae bacterium]
MLVTREQLREQVQRRELAPVYVLHGEETYLRDRAAKAIAEACFSKDDLRDFNEAEFSLSVSENFQRAIAAAEQFPMMAARRLVRIKDVSIAATAARDTLREEHEKALKAYLKSPSATSVVIFIANEFNGNRKISKLLKDLASIVEFSPLDEAGLRSWAESIFRRNGTAIDKSAVALLASLCGGDVARLESEAEKLITAALPEKAVTVELIETLVADHRELSNFALNDELNRGRGAAAIKALEKVLGDGAEPVMILGSLSYNFRKLAIVKGMMERGVERGEITRQMGVKYSLQEGYFAAARRTDRALLTYVIRRIADVDLAIKTSKGGADGPRKQLEVLVSEIASLNSARR